MHMFMLVVVVTTVRAVHVAMVVTVTVIGRYVFEEIGVDVQARIQVEAAQVQHLVQGHFAKVRHLNGRARVHVFEAVDQGVQGLWRHQVAFADENLVGKANLALGLLALVELHRGVFGVHQGQDPVEQILLGNFVVHEEGLRHGAWVGQAGGLDDHALEIDLAFALARGQVLQGGAQIVADGAADAAVAHLDDVFGGVGHQDLVVDVLFAELVFDDRDFLAVGLGEHALEQGGFARTQKAGEDGCGDECHGEYR